MFVWRRFFGIDTNRMMIGRIGNTQRVREFVFVEELAAVVQRGAAVSRNILL
jgi:hypothetical protein